MRGRQWFLGALAAIGTAIPTGSAPVELRDFISPHNRERPLRPSTDYIILHTTEAPSHGSLTDVYNNGTANFVVDWGGVVYRIIDRRKLALHAGRSMWKGLTNMDDYSIGIEVVGYHDRDISPAQYAALKQLLFELQQLYRIPDERVLTHSMVAYGTPNRWIKRSHRGRKRCGMLFALPSVRARLGLAARPACDPDVAAGRLIIGDPYLAKVLYGNVDQNAYGSRGTAPPAAGKIVPISRPVAGNEAARNASEGVRELGADGATAMEVAGEEYAAATTIYFLRNGRACKGTELNEAEFKALSPGTKILVGYASIGTVTARRHAFEICGARWSSAETYYLFPTGEIRSGNKVNDKTILRGTMVFVPN